MITNEILMQTLLGFGNDLAQIKESVTGLQAAAETPAPEPIYMSIQQACERYNLGRTSIKEIMCLGDAPKTIKVGSRRLLPIKEYDAFMRAQFAE